MRIFYLNDIVPFLSKKTDVMDVVKMGIIAQSHGAVSLPNPMQMMFERSDKTLSGDCHVKAAASGDYPYFCIKVATGFYDNRQHGLPVNNGLVMLLSADT